MPVDLEAAAAALEASGDYRVLRRLKAHEAFSPDDGSPKKIAVIVDLETTGLDASSDEIIELGMLKFSYGADGRVHRVLQTYSAFREPQRAIPEEITRLTGISPAMVAGKSIDTDAVTTFIEDAVLIIAHNASFDRPHCERSWPVFSTKHWGCSSSEVDWHARGHVGSRLGYLLADYGLFHGSHRALDDCRAVLEILSKARPPFVEPPLKTLLDTARLTTVRLWAEGAPFEKKDVLKARGYRWSGIHGAPRAWWREVAEADADTEVRFLRREIFDDEVIELPTRRVTALERFAERALVPDLPMSADMRARHAKLRG